jgi:ATP-dependent Clp protease ATP-binding subunit ClpA
MTTAPQHRYSPAVQRVIERADSMAIQRGNEDIGPAHLLLALLQEIESQKQENPDQEVMVAELLTRCGVERYKVIVHVTAFLEGEPVKAVSKRVYTPAIKSAFRSASIEATRCGSPSVDLEHLLPVLLDRRQEPLLAQMLEPLGLTAEKASSHLRQLTKVRQPLSINHPLAHLSVRGKRAIEKAEFFMRATYCGRISTLHLLLGILDDEDNIAVQTLKKQPVDLEKLKEDARKAVKHTIEIASSQRKFTTGTKRVLERALNEVKTMNHRNIGAEHLLLGMLSRPISLRELLLFGNNVEEDATLILTTLDTVKLRKDLLQELGFDSPVSYPPYIPEQAKQLCAFFISCVWRLVSLLGTISVTYLLFNAAKFVLTLDNMLLIGSAIIAFIILVFFRLPDHKRVSGSLLIGVATGLIWLWSVLYRP